MLRHEYLILDGLLDCLRQEPYTILGKFRLNRPFLLERTDRAKCDIHGTSFRPFQIHTERIEVHPKPTEYECQGKQSKSDPALNTHIYSDVSSTDINAFCGMFTEPTAFILLLPFFWASSSLRFRDTSPP